MAELVDALDLGSSGAIRGGSSPLTRTIFPVLPRIRGVGSANTRLRGHRQSRAGFALAAPYGAGLSPRRAAPQARPRARAYARSDARMCGASLRTPRSRAFQAALRPARPRAAHDFSRNIATRMRCGARKRRALPFSALRAARPNGNHSCLLHFVIPAAAKRRAGTQTVKWQGHNPHVEIRMQGPLRALAARDITRARFGMGLWRAVARIVRAVLSPAWPLSAPSRQGLNTHERPGKIRRRSLAHV